MATSATNDPSPYFLPANKAQGNANYPHARILPPGSKTVYVSGTSSRRGDGTFAGCTTSASGVSTLNVNEQTEAVLQNIAQIIDGASGGKGGMENVVDAMVLLIDMKDYAGMNEEWNKVWPDRNKAPTRTCMAVVALPNPKICVEIRCTVILN